MVRFAIFTAAAALAFTTPLTLAIPQTILDTQNGRANVGAANCGQFVTGECLSNEDCALGCCAGLPVVVGASGGSGSTVRGVCSNIKVGGAAGKLGCNFPLNDGRLSGVCGEGGTPAAERDPAAGTSLPVAVVAGGLGCGSSGAQNGGDGS
ncbi:hypothetical protein QBC33DRAFT_518434 [Phialemonium atrogriseum]|uniref:Biotrophy-associated secreted protein 2 n=1 Tax=Phialemonium atrogriseum TaxID=1093897 RepID=A0AAJ0FHU6_9PEZI|nr:uncharacterized protein QBC33DRAFT_518434 [Phialemonium atrogriseum]KAK1763738.1 hypothetical protein QBC33DRAFT_518434 [Phialemonium atrogriseum]